MKKYSLIISSKNLNSLNAFLVFFEKFNYLNFSYFQTIFAKKKKKKVFTLLKSPHVNKKAQEQFGINFYHKQITLIVDKKFKFLIFLKKLKIYTFPDVNIKFKTFITSKNNLPLSLFNPNNFKRKDYQNKNFKNKDYNLQLEQKIIVCEKNKTLIQKFDFYGSIKT